MHLPLVCRIAAIAAVVAAFPTSRAVAVEPIPDKLVVLTFDDSARSHFTVAGPLLKKYGFGATFFVTEGFDSVRNKRDYMTWEEIASLNDDGFEIGNHTRDHVGVGGLDAEKIREQLRAINERCQEHGIPVPVTFAYPGNAIGKEALPVLAELGIRFARRGGAPEFPYEAGRGFAYEPGLDHPLLVPTAGDARPSWTLADLERAVSQARNGRIAVLQFHGVPDTAHAHVNTPPERFESYMKYLAESGFTVIAMRDLERYVDPAIVPNDPWGVIEDRKRLLETGRDGGNARPRPAASDEELKYWLGNMAAHEFTAAESASALEMTAEEAEAAIERLSPAEPESRPDRLRVLPYPGGRHPRIGFRDGAIRPQRETKVSVFAPWPDGGYAVADVPEAVWFEPTGGRELLYLAHTHVPTWWDKQGVRLDPLEWNRRADGSLAVERVLPNKVTLGSSVVPGSDGVRMEFRIDNGGGEPLTGLNTQMCIMVGRLAGFEDRTNDNKVFDPPFAACHDRTGRRWLITAWERCGRAWGNPPCPCLHSDPQLADCPPGETSRVRGWISFYEGDDVMAELRRLRDAAFREPE